MGAVARTEVGAVTVNVAEVSPSELPQLEVYCSLVVRHAELHAVGFNLEGLPFHCMLILQTRPKLLKAAIQPKLLARGCK